MYNLNIAVLSNFTCDVIENQLRALLSSYPIQIDFYMAGFNQIEANVLHTKSALYHFNPDVIILLLDEHILFDRMPRPWIVSQYLKKATDETMNYIQNVLLSITENSHALIVTHTIPVSENSLNQVIDYHSKAMMSFSFCALNQMIIKASLDNQQIISIDSAVLLQNEQVTSLRDERLSLYASMHFHDTLLCQLSHEIVKIIVAKLGLTKKCLVLDLDNTLWGGIIGDDGVTGIALGGSDEGHAYKKFQQAIQQLKTQGVLLAINSKNTLENVTEVFSSHPDMCLSLADFVCVKVNWQPKNDNMRAISTLLNIHLDSMVFVDDNPAECALIQQDMPEVSILCLSTDPSCYVDELMRTGLFNQLAITQEDFSRTAMYHAEIQRKDFLISYHCDTNITAYLHHLNIQLDIFIPNAIQISRLSQLSLRTNQFNLTGIRYTQHEMNQLLLDEHYFIVGIETADRFGENGIVGAVFLEIIEHHLHIHNFLLSCRVFSREIETAICIKLLEFAQKKGFTSMMGQYVPSPKNSIVQDFYIKNGFQVYSEKKYSYQHLLNNIQAVPAWINITSCVLEH